MIEGIDRLNEVEWEVKPGFVPEMRVPGKFFLSDSLAETLEEGAIKQLANVATLPGILKYSYGMPDIHWGYGFPIGGVAAFEMETGIISPGGVGFDINCGVRLLTTPLKKSDLGKPKRLINELFHTVPTGVGTRSEKKLSADELEDMMCEGAKWAVNMGYGTPEDLNRCEEKGFMEAADTDFVSKKARLRGMPQCGTLGSGNHFLEIQEVSEIMDPEVADKFGVSKDQICVMIHCGSRGLGHQVCTDHLKDLESATKKYHINIPDAQLACAPIKSDEGKAYFGAMAASANYAWANRQMITHMVREIFEKVYKIDYSDMKLVYDVTHNVAKYETHVVNGQKTEVCVHRKGATRAFGPGCHDIPHELSDFGQPVIIPGSMGTSSYLLKGTQTAMEKTFGSTCHGSGRIFSRSKAKKSAQGAEIKDELEKKGIFVKATSNKVIAEESPEAYKPSSEVVSVVHKAGISLEVARLEPIGVIKG
ncbi:RtcB family protein [Methanoplanus sp. FWC-SCC4]|uniref:tRNA-splicing ligase RtcB n=1 Tax=Methanochimaera problematica TaxID=2609417 RepID=A0AA97FDI9_9EURY|nr:RtcB family protein [Methanoplanus sp. FWC-SCC4]WOF16058.1 RtcB family protein [Methanoplanus sp. FWC-SCC4]